MCLLGCWPVNVLAQESTPEATSASDPEAQFRQLLSTGDYELARKLAVVHFRPDWHCEIYLYQANQLADQAQHIIVAQQAAQAPAQDQLDLSAGHLRQAREFSQKANLTAQQYIDAGWDEQLEQQIAAAYDRTIDRLDDLSTQLDVLRNQGKGFDQLLAEDNFSPAEIQKLEPLEQFITGCYLADRGRFDDARNQCFGPLQRSSNSTLKRAASVASDLLEQWYLPADSNRKWDNLVLRGLDAYERLKEQSPESAAAAGWLLALSARLARDHYDVPTARIQETLQLVEGFTSPPDDSPANQLLTAKLDYERFLLSRRSEIWNAKPTDPDDIRRFMEARCSAYAAEASLTAAAVARQAGDDFASHIDNCKAMIEQIKTQNPDTAEAISRHLERFDVTYQAFDTWRQHAQTDKSYQDRRGTVLPDVLFETRPQLVHRVRSGYEQIIADHLSAGRVDDAFLAVQQAKALSVGRIAKPTSFQALISAKLFSLGMGGESMISRKELFVEYYIGPARAWAFYTFAPGDQYEPMEVIELDREQLLAKARKTLSETSPANRHLPRCRATGCWEMTYLSISYGVVLKK